MGDAVASFSPADDNRYYLYQKPIEVFTKVYAVQSGGTLAEITDAYNAGWDGVEIKKPYEDLAAIQTAYDDRQLIDGDVVLLNTDRISTRDDATFAEQYLIYISDYHCKVGDGGRYVRRAMSCIGSELGGSAFGVAPGTGLCWYNTENYLYEPFDTYLTAPDENTFIAINPGWFVTGNMSAHRGLKGDNTSQSYTEANRTETANNYYLPTVSSVDSTPNVNVYLGNNGRIIVDNARLAVTKEVIDENGRHIFDDTRFSYDIHIDNYTGLFTAIKLEYHDPDGDDGVQSGHWDFILKEVAVFTDGNDFILASNGTDKAVAEFNGVKYTMKVIPETPAYNPSTHKLTLTSANRHFDPSDTEGEYYSFEPDQIEFYDITGKRPTTYGGEMPVVWKTVLSDGSGLDAGYGNTNMYADDFKTESTWDTVELNFSMSGEATFTLAGGEGLFFSSITPESNYIVTETITQEQFNCGYNYESVTHHEKNTTGTALHSAEEGITSTAGDEYTYSVTGDADIGVECVHWTNSKILADMTIAKVLRAQDGTQYDIYDTDNNVAFDFDVTFTSPKIGGPLVGPYTYSIYKADGSLDAAQTDQSLVLDAGTGHFKLKAGEKIVIKDLPLNAGYTYVIQETAADGYEFGGDHSDGRAEGTIDRDTVDEQYITFTNVKKTANPVPVSLSITKNIDSVVTSFDWNKKVFAFRITPEEDNPVSDPLKDGLTVTSEGVDTTDKSAVVKLLNGQLFGEIGTYKYVVSEVDTGIPGITYDTTQYHVTVIVTEEQGDHGFTGNLTAAVSITKDSDLENTDIVFTNRYEEVGALRVTKNVIGEEADYDRQWHFTVKLSDKEFNGGPYYKDGDEDMSSPITFENGAASFTLKHGESIVFTGIPDGVAYTVVEDDANKDAYKTTVDKSDGMIETDVEASVTYNNEKLVRELPETGGSGLSFIYCLGLVAIVTSISLVLILSRRKRFEIR